MSLADTRLLARRCPACRRREPGLRLSRQNVGRPVPTLPAGNRWREEASQAAETVRD